MSWIEFVYDYLQWNCYGYVVKEKQGVGSLHRACAFLCYSRGFDSDPGGPFKPYVTIPLLLRCVVLWDRFLLLLLAVDFVGDREGHEESCYIGP